MSNADRTINAAPTKAFFVDMLTRDISVTESILDLIDNAIHNVIRAKDLDVMRVATGKERSRRLTGNEIKIRLDKSRFEITDTCGGISIDDARNDVFRFGKSRRDRRKKGLGVYGIGMKRAFFKIGNEITIQSQTTTEKFAVDIDVEDWKQADDWTFEFRYAQRLPRTPRKSGGGTTIRIDDLHPTVRRHFGLQTFSNDLLGKISRTYALFLREGIVIAVNGKKAQPDLPEFARSHEIGLTRQQFRHDGVDILVMIGVTPAIDRVPRGWYVFCNGRMVLDADKSALTGWKNGAQWVPKFNHFLGWVLFASDKVDSLPWRTTKEGIDFESDVYQFALGKMRTHGKPVLSHLAKRYPGDVQEAIPEREVMERAKAVSVLKVASSRDTLFSVAVPKKSEAKTVKIQYDRPKTEVRRIGTSLNRPGMAASRVGEYTFEYYLRNFCK